MIRPDVTLEDLNRLSKGTMAEHLGIEFTEVGADFIAARMPVVEKTKQPMGLLHGGASVALAETLGSVAAYCVINLEKQHAVGLEINANHVRGVSEGFVYGKALPLHIGKTTHVWEIKIVNEQNKLVCVSRITVAVLDKK
jgi:1,4-dihydroxy-2-naphthoyl-CoA hydrolase